MRCLVGGSLSANLSVLAKGLRGFPISAFVGLGAILITIPIPTYVGKLIVAVQEKKMGMVSAP